MISPMRAAVILAVFLPEVASAQFLGPIATGGVRPPPMIVPLHPSPMAVSIQVAPSRSIIPPAPAPSPTPIQAETWSVNVQIIPPPGPPAEPPETEDCHDQNAVDNENMCEESIPPSDGTSEEATIVNQGSAGAEADATEQPLGQPLSNPQEQPNRSGFSWWWIVIAVVLGALLIGWIRSIRLR